MSGRQAIVKASLVDHTSPGSNRDSKYSSVSREGNNCAVASMIKPSELAGSQIREY